MNRRATVGFDRRIDIEWLDAAAAQAAVGADAASLRTYLWGMLDGVVRGDTFNSGRGKTVTVLTHIWGDVPESCRGLRDRAIATLPEASPDERLAIHWAMMTATYPVFTDVADAAGRLLTLQGSFALAHLVRRLTDQWGERSTVIRAGQRIVRSMIQWGALSDTAERGVYTAPTEKVLAKPSQSLLLLEALLIDAHHESLPLDRLLSHSTLFPFEMHLGAEDLRNAPQFNLSRQGLDLAYIELVGR